MLGMRSDRRGRSRGRVVVSRCSRRCRSLLPDLPPACRWRDRRRRPGTLLARRRDFPPPHTTATSRRAALPGPSTRVPAPGAEESRCRRRSRRRALPQPDRRGHEAVPGSQVRASMKAGLGPSVPKHLLVALRVRGPRRPGARPARSVTHWAYNRPRARRPPPRTIDLGQRCALSRGIDSRDAPISGSSPARLDAAPIALRAVDQLPHTAVTTLADGQQPWFKRRSASPPGRPACVRDQS